MTLPGSEPRSLVFVLNEMSGIERSWGKMVDYLHDVCKRFVLGKSGTEATKGRGQLRKKFGPGIRVGCLPSAGLWESKYDHQVTWPILLS